MYNEYTGSMDRVEKKACHKVLEDAVLVDGMLLYCDLFVLKKIFDWICLRKSHYYKMDFRISKHVFTDGMA